MMSLQAIEHESREAAFVAVFDCPVPPDKIAFIDAPVLALLEHLAAEKETVQ